MLFIKLRATMIQSLFDLAHQSANLCPKKIFAHRYTLPHIFKCTFRATLCHELDELGHDVFIDMCNDDDTFNKYIHPVLKPNDLLISIGSHFKRIRSKLTRDALGPYIEWTAPEILTRLVRDSYPTINSSNTLSRKDWLECVEKYCTSAHDWRRIGMSISTLFKHDDMPYEFVFKHMLVYKIQLSDIFSTIHNYNILLPIELVDFILDNFNVTPIISQVTASIVLHNCSEAYVTYFLRKHADTLVWRHLMEYEFTNEQLIYFIDYIYLRKLLCMYNTRRLANIRHIRTSTLVFIIEHATQYEVNAEREAITYNALIILAQRHVDDNYMTEFARIRLQRPEWIRIFVARILMYNPTERVLSYYDDVIQDNKINTNYHI